MIKSMNWDELWALLGTPNAELDDERLEFKARALCDFAEDEGANGYDFGYYKKTLERIECEKELDRRHGIVRTYYVPKWPQVSTRRRSSKRWTKRK